MSDFSLVMMLLQAAGEVEIDLQRLLFSLITAQLIVEQEVPKVHALGSSCP